MTHKSSLSRSEAMKRRWAEGKFDHMRGRLRALFRQNRDYSNVRKMSPEEAAWVGALLEGEGCIYQRSWPDGRFQSQLQIASTEIETIATCLRLVGDGGVSMQKPYCNRKRAWVWYLSRPSAVRDVLRQVSKYLTGKREKAIRAFIVMSPVSGSSCHPAHFEGAADTIHNSPEQIERNWREFFKQDKVDPRAIRRQHRFKFGHEVDYAEPESGWKYLTIKREPPPGDPDQRNLLTGGPESGLSCERCGEMTRVVGRMSAWDIMHQERVDVANEADITEARKRELQKEFIVVLACPECKLKVQFREEFLPKVVQRG